MRSLVLIILFLQLLVTNSCASRNKDTMQSWLNNEYIECLKSSLPCECEKQISTFYSLVLDTNPQSRNFGVALSNFKELEPQMYPIRKVGTNSFEVLKNQPDGTSWAKLDIKNGVLEFKEGSKLYNFSKSRTSKGYALNHYKTDNIYFLDEALISLGHPKFEDIVGEDSLNCDCNKWMGGQNLLYVKGKSQSWTLELKSDSLIIAKIVNIDRDPDDAIQAERIGVYKWR